MINIVWTGLPDMLMRLKKIADDWDRKVGAALYAEAQIMMTESKLRCPVSPTAAQFKAMGRTPPKGLVPGTLRASGRVSPPEKVGPRTVVTLTYGGGGAIQYAVVQHERLDFHHTNGQAKYLESVMNEARPELAARIAKRLHFDNPTGEVAE